MAEGFNVEAYLRDGIAHVDTEIDALNAQITQLADAKQGLQGALDAHLAHGKPKLPAAKRAAKPKPEPRVKVTERWVRDGILSLAVQLTADPEFVRNGVSEHVRRDLLPGYFRASDLALRMGVAVDSPRRILQGLAKRGMLESKRWRGGSQYRYIDPRTVDPKTGPKPVATDVVAGVDAVAGTGRQMRSGSAEIDSLLKDARQAGAVVSKDGSGHMLIQRDGKSLRIPSTPSTQGSARTARSMVEKFLAGE